MDYGYVLTRGWEAIWQNKWLWILGFLVALNISNVIQPPAELNQQLLEISRAGSDPELVNDPEAVLELFQSTLDALGEWFTSVIGLIAAFSVIGMLYGIVRLAARAGLISGVYQSTLGKPTSFGSAIGGGFGKVIRLILFKILIALPGIILTLVFLGVIGGALGSSINTITSAAGFSEVQDAFGELMSGEATEEDVEAVFGDFFSQPEVIDAAQAASGGFSLVFASLCLLMCIGTPLLLLMGFIDAFGFRGIVTQDLGAWAGFKHGWTVTRKHLGQWFVLGLVMFIILAIVGGIVAALVSFVVSTAGIGGIGGGVILTAMTALLLSIFVAWQSSAFTVAYMEVNEFNSGLSEKEKTPDMINPTI